MKKHIGYVLGIGTMVVIAVATIVTGYRAQAASDTVTREQAAVMIAEKIGVNYTIITQDFGDVDTSRNSFAAIETLYRLGITSGCASNPLYFCPDRLITRGEFVTLVVRAKQYSLITPTYGSFSDVPASNPFYAYIETAKANGIVAGFGDGTFRPNDFVTNFHANAILASAFSANSSVSPTPGIPAIRITAPTGQYLLLGTQTHIAWEISNAQSLTNPTLRLELLYKGQLLGFFADVNGANLKNPVYWNAGWNTGSYITGAGGVYNAYFAPIADGYSIRATLGDNGKPVSQYTTPTFLLTKIVPSMTPTPTYTYTTTPYPTYYPTPTYSYYPTPTYTYYPTPTYTYYPTPTPYITPAYGTITIKNDPLNAPPTYITAGSNALLGAFTIDNPGNPFWITYAQFDVGSGGSIAAGISPSLSSVVIKDVQGTVIAGPTSQSPQGQVTFFDSFIVPTGISYYRVYGTVAASYPIGATVNLATTPWLQWLPKGIKPDTLMLMSTMTIGKTVPTPTPSGYGTLSGRVVAPGNTKTNNTQFLADSSTAKSCRDVVRVSRVIVYYTGPVSGSTLVNLCNPQPYFKVRLPVGVYNAFVVAEAPGKAYPYSSVKLIVSKDKVTTHWFYPYQVSATTSPVPTSQPKTVIYSLENLKNGDLVMAQGGKNVYSIEIKEGILKRHLYRMAGLALMYGPDAMNKVKFVTQETLDLFAPSL